MVSDEEYSDLTELESDDYTENTQKKAKTDDSGKGGYRIRNALKVPRATTYTAQALYDQIHSNDINLEPEYQRDVVWSEAKQIGVIDSIYRNFYIPPIIFAVNCHEDGSETRTCIDGKQRLTSIHKFMDGLIPHKDAENGEKHWYKDAQTSGRTKRKLLSLKYRKMFANKQIVCVEYQEIDDAAEREIFQRVQLGMALTPAEKLQVIKTSRADFIRELQNTFMKEEGSLSGGSLEWDTSRGSDFRGLAQAVYCMDKLDIGEGLKSTTGMPQLEKWLSARQPFEADFMDNVRDAYQVFANMVQDKKYTQVFKKPAKVSPIEFIMMGVMIYAHKDEASMAQLAAGISQMRVDVRVAHVDIRMNSRVTKFMTDFITKWKPSKVAGDAGVPVGNTSTTIGVKRKRPARKDEDMDVDGDEDADDDDDDDGTYRASKSKKPTKKANNAAASSPTSTAKPTKVKTEPTSTPPTTTPLIFPHPPTDRMAALRRAKEAVAQNQAQRQIPAAPKAMGLPTKRNAANGQAPSPQMLPSPGQPFTFPSSLNTPKPPSSSSSRLPLPNANGSGQTIRLPPLPQSASGSSTSLDSTLMATMMHSNRVASSSSSSRPNALPPPPVSGGSTISDRDRDDKERDRDDRERDRDREKDRPYDYPRRDSRDYDDRDRYRYAGGSRESVGHPSRRR